MGIKTKKVETYKLGLESRKIIKGKQNLIKN